QHLFDCTHTLACAPDVLPGLRARAACAEIHFRRVGDREVVGVEATAHQAVTQVVAVNARDEIGVHDLRCVAVDDHLLVVVVCIGFFGGNEGRPDIGEVGPCGLGGQNGIAVGNRA